jgi:NAD(P)-dependent dehydrogenase (short-subunit alcohol dehydrogenase family)
MTAGVRRGIAAFIAGATLGATAAAGTALLLYTGQGFLRAAGLLVASTIVAIAAGVWAGSPDPDDDAHVGSRGRWVALVLVLLAGGAFTALWATRPALRELAVGGAFAVLLVLALPAYTAGSLLVALHVRERAALPPALPGSMAALGVAGTATGVLLSTTVLIPNLEPFGVYYGGAGVLTLAALLEWNLPARGATGGVPDMRDYVAIITGVGDPGQIGFAVARTFRDAGARLLITGLSPRVEQLAAELDADHDVYGVSADLTVDADIKRLIEVATERFGRVDALVNVAGGLSVMKPVAETTPEEWQQELQRNTETALRMSRAALPLLRESAGAIVNFAAPAGLRAVAGLGAYSAAKAGVIALTRALALEEKKHGVRVNAIAPGIADTDQNRASMGDDAVFVPRGDIASVALFLAGPGARGISGETIHVLGPTLR